VAQEAAETPWAWVPWARYDYFRFSIQVRVRLFELRRVGGTKRRGRFSNSTDAETRMDAAVRTPKTALIAVRNPEFKLVSFR
jgi:hypothetical protein